MRGDGHWTCRPAPYRLMLHVHMSARFCSFRTDRRHLKLDLDRARLLKFERGIVLDFVAAQQVDARQADALEEEGLGLKTSAPDLLGYNCR